tara:strand:- start:830 stop:1279 length:450 start_codon:yes stop_codon:yes gene_type:complete
MMTAILILLGLVAVGTTAVRVWPVDSRTYVIDAFDVRQPKSPNFYISTDEEGQFSLPAMDVALQIQAMVKEMPRTNMLFISDDKLSQTYVSRTLLMGYPDYISVSIRAVSPNSTTIKIFSRSRFGKSDLGVNQRRVHQWLRALREKLGA